MAGPIKSVLLVDYASVLRSVTVAGGKAANAFGAHVREWVAAIESGTLAEPSGQVRMLTVRRCYAEPGLIGQRSAGFTSAGFELVDLGAEDGDGSADLTIAMDAMEATTGADAAEVILLSASPGLGNLIRRIKARGRKVVAYAEEAAADAYRATADGLVNAADFVDVLNAAGAPPERPKALVSAADRGRIEAFAREINGATSIPMFSPRTFAELFRLLCEEISTNGYHFQSTAKNVAERLGGSGRTVTSRQVVFVVKGLALKGHVFSTTDTPERLAEVFREQARYLVANAGITLDAEREKLLNAWITAPATKPAPAPQPAAKKEAPKPQPPAKVPAAPPAAPARPAPVVVAPAPVAVEAKPVRKPPPERRPEQTSKAPPPKPPTPPRSNALPPKPAPPPPEPPKPDVRAQIAARIAASAKIKPPARPTPPPAPKPAPPKAAEVAPRKPDAIESSILAAIAEAVDVLVEDSGGKPQPPAPKTAQPPEPPREKAPPAARPAPPPEPLPEPEEGSDDIGDEIQRIVASYNRNREGGTGGG